MSIPIIVIITIIIIIIIILITTAITIAIITAKHRLDILYPKIHLELEDQDLSMNPFRKIPCIPQFHVRLSLR